MFVSLRVINVDVKVRKYKVPTKKNEIVNRLNKTKREDHPDLAGLSHSFGATNDSTSRLKGSP